MKKYNFDEIYKDYVAEMINASDIEDFTILTARTMSTSRKWIGTLIGICKGLQKQITELEETMQKMKTNGTDRSLKWKRQFD